MIRLAIATIAYGGQVCSQHAAMMFKLGAAAEAYRNCIYVTQLAQWDINPVDRARNIALADAMTKSADWLLMVDADTFTLDGQGLLDMIIEGRKLDASVVAAPVMSRDIKAPLLMAYRRDCMRGRYVSLSLTRDADTKGLVRVHAAASAMMAINLAKVGNAEFKFYPADDERPGMSEDIGFCWQIESAGGSIYVDTRVVTGHMSRPVPIFSGG